MLLHTGWALLQLLQEQCCCLEALLLQEEEVVQEDLSCEVAWMDPVHGELEPGEEDPRTWRTETMTGPSAVHPSLSCGQNKNPKPCSDIKKIK